jgi:uncharacterized protein RhaS with RHS repeats
VGRWTSEDPSGLQPDPNPYRYVHNRPTDATDPRGLLELTAKSLGKGPQTGFYEGKFYFYWGVALFLDKDGLDELNKAGGGYVVSKRTITWKYGDEKGSKTAWFLDPITFDEGKLVPNRDYSNGKGGPRNMQDESTSAAYFSIINNAAKKGTRIPIGIDSAKGEVKVEQSYWLFKGAPGKDVRDKFPKSGSDQSELGWDEFQHKPWTLDDPKIDPKDAVAKGDIDATITWAKQEHTFTSKAISIGEGPQRDIGKAFFDKFWVYDKEMKKWVLK